MATLREKLAERERDLEERAVLRAGLVAAAIYNVHRKKGTRAVMPTDFIAERPKHLTPEEMERALTNWAQSINQGISEA